MRLADWPGILGFLGSVASLFWQWKTHNASHDLELRKFAYEQDVKKISQFESENSNSQRFVARLLELEQDLYKAHDFFQVELDQSEECNDESFNWENIDKTVREIFDGKWKALEEGPIDFPEDYRSFLNDVHSRILLSNHPAISLGSVMRGSEWIKTTKREEQRKSEARSKKIQELKQKHGLA